MRSYCEICDRYGEVHRHHVFPGTLRSASERYDATAMLCVECHEGAHGVHRNRELAEELKARTQKRVMRREGWTMEQWRLVFGKSYIWEEELDEDDDNEEGWFIAL